MKVLDETRAAASPTHQGMGASLQIRIDGPVAVHTLLRAFDRLRRDLARALCGAEGIFAGYDQLELSAREDCQSEEVVITAFATARQGPHEGQTRIAVDYFAEYSGTTGLGSAGGNAPCTILARGSGLTLLTP